MSHPFDPGYVREPYLTLCAAYPEANVYPASQFRVEWGPIFHRGRLDGTARVLVLGQDPAQHETVVRRILVGEAGRRVQGLLGKLGITRSYVLLNTYLYSVHGSVRAQTRRHPALVDYRNRWLNALLVGTRVQVVIALGTAADDAWELWAATQPRRAAELVYAAVMHPTQPESSSRNDKSKLPAATARLLQNWNAALRMLAPALESPDQPTTWVPYGDTWGVDERPPIPEFDYPAGLPAWMHELDGWARRSGANALAKRRNLTLTVPKGLVS